MASQSIDLSGRGSVTLKDVAALAGVSVSTASLVLSGRHVGRVGEATRERVERAASDLGYSGNSLARGLRTQRSRTIGFVSDKIATTPFAVRMIQAAQEVAWERGLLLFLINTDGNVEFEHRAITSLRAQKVEGIVYACMSHHVVNLPPGLGADTVFLNSRPAKNELPSVVPDERQGAFDAVCELLKAGHERVAFIYHGKDTAPGVLRLRGYVEALESHGLAYDSGLVAVAERSIEGAAEAAHALLRREQPTGLFCYSDRIAAGVYRAAAHLGLSIPNDLSVVGFDDQEFLASALTPALTTVALPHEAMGRWAMQNLLDSPARKVAEGGFDPLLMTCELVRRDSVCPPPLVGN